MKKMSKKKNVTKFSVEKRYLHKFCNHAETVSDEARVILDSDGIRTKVVDPAHVCMVDVFLHKEAFDKFQLTDDEEVEEDYEREIGLPIYKLRNFMNVGEIKFDDQIRVEIYEHEDYSSTFMSLETTAEELFTLNDTKRMLDTVGMINPSLPELDYPIRVETSNKALRVMCKHVNKMDDHIVIQFDDGEFELYGEGDAEGEDSSMKLQQLDIKEGKDGRVKSRFTLDYLTDIANTIKKSNDIEISLGIDYPVRIESQFEDGMGMYKYLLAPRVESE